MDAFPLRRGLLVPGLCGLLAMLPSAGQAQERAATDTVRWAVNAPRAGWCVNFLMEPVAAAEDLTRGFRVVAAREVHDLPPAISRLISEEPTYADWVPSEVCIYIGESISVQGRRYDRGDGGQPPAVLYWGVAAASEGSTSEAGEVSLRAFGSNSSGVGQNMGTRGIPIDRIQFEVHPVSESTDQDYLIKLNGAAISYTGAPKPDTAATVTLRERTGSMNGNNRAVWTVRMSWHPTAVGGMSGALRVVGKKGLAKAMNRSPIRLLSPTIIGGSGEVTFNR